MVDSVGHTMLEPEQPPPDNRPHIPSVAGRFRQLRDEKMASDAPLTTARIRSNCQAPQQKGTRLAVLLLLLGMLLIAMSPTSASSPAPSAATAQGGGDARHQGVPNVLDTATRPSSAESDDTQMANASRSSAAQPSSSSSARSQPPSLSPPYPTPSPF